MCADKDIFLHLVAVKWVLDSQRQSSCMDAMHFHRQTTEYAETKVMEFQSHTWLTETQIKHN